MDPEGGIGGPDPPPPPLENHKFYGFPLYKLAFRPYLEKVGPPLENVGPPPPPLKNVGPRGVSSETWKIIVFFEINH